MLGWGEPQAALKVRCCFQPSGLRSFAPWLRRTCPVSLPVQHRATLSGLHSFWSGRASVGAVDLVRWPSESKIVPHLVVIRGSPWQGASEATIPSTAIGFAHVFQVFKAQFFHRRHGSGGAGGEVTGLRGKVAVRFVGLRRGVLSGLRSSGLPVTPGVAPPNNGIKRTPPPRCPACAFAAAHCCTIRSPLRLRRLRQPLGRRGGNEHH